jgi:hypothetical protein
MRVIVATILGLAALATSSIQTAAAPSKAYSSARLHETPPENVRKSQWYDHLLSTNPRFRAYRIRKECDPIAHDPRVAPRLHQVFRCLYARQVGISTPPLAPWTTFSTTDGRLICSEVVLIEPRVIKDEPS